MGHQGVELTWARAPTAPEPGPKSHAAKVAHSRSGVLASEPEQAKDEARLGPNIEPVAPMTVNFVIPPPVVTGNRNLLGAKETASRAREQVRKRPWPGAVLRPFTRGPRVVKRPAIYRLVMMRSRGRLRGGLT